MRRFFTNLFSELTFWIILKNPSLNWIFGHSTAFNIWLNISCKLVKDCTVAYLLFVAYYCLSYCPLCIIYVPKDQKIIKNVACVVFNSVISEQCCVCRWHCVAKAKQTVLSVNLTVSSWAGKWLISDNNVLFALKPWSEILASQPSSDWLLTFWVCVFTH